MNFRALKLRVILSRTKRARLVIEDKIAVMPVIYGKEVLLIVWLYRMMSKSYS